MTMLPKDKLLEYLKNAIELESSILAQKQIVSTYIESAERRKPTYTEVKPQVYHHSGSTPNTENRRMGIGLIIIGILFFVPILIALLANGMSFGYSFAVSSIGLIPLIVGIVFFRNYQQQETACMEEHYQVMDANKRAEEEAKKTNRERYEQYHKKQVIWSDSNREILDFVNAPLRETTAILEELYAFDYIYPKYRNLPALTSIYEYLITGRCEELSGPHGAYNLYEDEVRKDTVISQLNTVIENLEQIRQNQYMLYEQVKGIQQATRAIAVEMYQIKGYTAYLTELTALNTYYTGISAMNSTALAYCRSL